MTQMPPPPQQPTTMTHMEPHRGVLILVLGILSLTVCGILAPFAWVMGNTDLEKMRAGQMDPSGEGLTQGHVAEHQTGAVIIRDSSVFPVQLADARLPQKLMLFSVS